MLYKNRYPNPHSPELIAAEELSLLQIQEEYANILEQVNPETPFDQSIADKGRAVLMNIYEGNLKRLEDDGKDTSRVLKPVLAEDGDLGRLAVARRVIQGHVGVKVAQLTLRFSAVHLNNEGKTIPRNQYAVVGESMVGTGALLPAGIFNNEDVRIVSGMARGLEDLRDYGWLPHLLPSLADINTVVPNIYAGMELIRLPQNQDWPGK